jgi:XRE family aerobic/anaerobic benzoate catabolism transcriptional regulator
MTRVVSQGDMRPMRGREQAMGELRGILAQRESLYRLADVTLDTSRMTREEVVAGIVAELN